MKNKDLNADKFNKLYKEVIKFNKARGWNPAASDIAKSIVIESAELLEHFQWDESDSNKHGHNPQHKNWIEIGDELADIIWYIISFCEETGINLADAMEHKLKHNLKKYPEEKFSGKHNDKFYRSQKKKYRQNKKLVKQHKS